MGGGGGGGGVKAIPRTASAVKKSQMKGNTEKERETDREEV
jgi:hypothetical protein